MRLWIARNGSAVRRGVRQVAVRNVFVTLVAAHHQAGILPIPTKAAFLASLYAERTIVRPGHRQSLHPTLKPTGSTGGIADVARCHASYMPNSIMSLYQFRLEGSHNFNLSNFTLNRSWFYG